MNITPLKFIASVALTLLLCARPAKAHEDTRILLKGTRLLGLPYEPAELDVKASRLRVGDREMTFTPYLKSFFDTPHDLHITASWYHRNIAPKLPPYLVIQIQPKKRHFAYEIMLNLNTLELIEFSVELQESDSSTRSVAIQMGDQVRKEIRKSVRTVK